MYDEDASCMASMAAVSSGPISPPYGPQVPQALQHHWYDEPPYESDPEDFLMGANPDNQLATPLANGRCILLFHFKLKSSFAESR